MGYVKDMVVERENGLRDLVEALSDADSAIEALLTIGLLNAAERQQFEGYQAALLGMYGELEAKRATSS